MRMSLQRRLNTGFSLIEVLVTLIVVSTGLLGIAKMHAAVLSNTQVSRVRSLTALQAESLASAMRSNRGFWATGSKSFTASGTTIVDTAGVLNGTRDCSTNTCTTNQLAAYDTLQWATNLNSRFPGYTAAVSCAGTPVNCTVNISWQEKYVAINRSTAASAPAQQASTQNLTLYVQP
jgi:type IV pilus assembly protein PilV